MVGDARGKIDKGAEQGECLPGGSQNTGSCDTE
jgi:hypothetical protein